VGLCSLEVLLLAMVYEVGHLHISKGGGGDVWMDSRDGR